eukprot:6080287-Pleurochrysis_carterae.AAC.1
MQAGRRQRNKRVMEDGRSKIRLSRLKLPFRESRQTCKMGLISRMMARAMTPDSLACPACNDAGAERVSRVGRGITAPGREKGKRGVRRCERRREERGEDGESHSESERERVGERTKELGRDREGEVEREGAREARARDPSAHPPVVSTLSSAPTCVSSVCHVSIVPSCESCNRTCEPERSKALPLSRH